MAGALVGGLATFSGTAFNARSARKQSLAARTHAVQDRRYEAHLDYIRGVARFYEAALEVRVALSEQRSNAQEAQRRHIDAYSALRELEGAAEFAGPRELRANLRELHDQLLKYSRQIDRWYSAAVATVEEDGEWMDTKDNRRFGSSCHAEWTKTEEFRARFLDKAHEVFAV
ncbi:hypothetical protein AB0H60_35610 [Nocardia rhamnosiphila]|uniref:hypothetical protein n=1 Tax=Nocardia rhamnosiphila TaxID=426716 RepID=UPI0033E94252